MSDFDILDVKFTFKRRPLDLPGDLRPNWRVPVLLLMLHMCCRGGKSSLYKLHLLNWTMRDKHRMEALADSVSSTQKFDEIQIQVEPSFIQAIQFAVGEGLVEKLDNHRVKITEAGKNFANDIQKAECLEGEKAFLKSIGFKLTEDWVAGFAAWSRAA